MAESADAQDQLTCNGFSAWIVVDGAESKVYGVEHDGEDNASCWIESEMGKEFSIAFLQNKGASEYTAHVTLDGHKVSHIVYSKDCAQKQNVVSTIIISATESSKFVFASLELTDDDGYLESHSENIGAIIVTIRPIKSYKVVKATPTAYCKLPNSGKVHERLKKGLAHRVKYVAQQDATQSRRQLDQCEYHDQMITFTFRYRPLAMLQATGIIPHIPPVTKSKTSQCYPVASTSDEPKKRRDSVVNAEHSDDENALDKEEDSGDDSEREKAVLAELERIKKERELLAELEKIRSRKRTKKQSQQPAPKKVKSEPKLHFVQGEVIDLT
ncbi:hypothetical protein BDN70DRAFT_878590 [Pholiota conissans]|uniref:DUF7918 domain-containing protein n=1 Tax=Pholiota conissans TaxID=109636 RepID=A0A9P5Z3X2_9AGAR|nr:hypothetical protein BDN70DRAFT_878590 [Pholiota conissans]